MFGDKQSGRQARRSDWELLIPASEPAPIAFGVKVSRYGGVHCSGMIKNAVIAG
jgi:hypothetical protein